MNEDELRRMLHQETGPGHDRDGWATTAVRAGRRRRVVRRAAGAGTALAVVAVAVVGAQALPRTLTAPVQPASPSVTATPTPTPTASDPAPSPPPTATAPEPPVETAVIAGGYRRDAAVYTVVRGSATPVLQRELDPPVDHDAYVVDIAVASGDDPLACVVWALSPDADGLRGGERELSCYAPGSSEPARVAVPDGLRAAHVALRPDASAIAWSEEAPEGNGRVQVADLDGVVAGTARTWTADPTKPTEGEQSFTGLSVVGLAFAGDTDRLLVSVAVQSDDGPGIGEIDVAAPGGSWGPVGRLRHPAEGSQIHDRYTNVGSATPTTAFAILSSYALREEPAPGDLGVLVSLHDGTVVDTLVTPEGRRVAVVSGSSTGALAYTTASLDEGDDRDGRRHYVRWDGEESGTQLDGPVAGWPTVRIAP